MSRRFAPILLVLLGLAACGFEPLYGEQGAAQPQTQNLLEQVSVPPIADRTGQLLRIELTNRLTPKHPAPPPLYSLSVSLLESRQSLAVERDSTATRANLTISVSFGLVRISDGQTLTASTIRSVNSYDILTSDYATLAAEADARKRAARDIADGIVDRVAIYLSRVRQP